MGIEASSIYELHFSASHLVLLDIHASNKNRSQLYCLPSSFFNRLSLTLLPQKKPWIIYIEVLNNQKLFISARNKHCTGGEYKNMLRTNVTSEKLSWLYHNAFVS